MLESCTGQKVAEKWPTLFVIRSLKMGCHHRTGTGKFLISTSLTVDPKLLKEAPPTDSRPTDTPAR